MDNEVKKVFTPKPMISCRSPRKMSSYLLRAKLHLEERTKGSFKCGSKRCEVCLNVNEKYTFTSTVTGETYIISHKFNCNDKCLAYLLTCNCCRKQNVGQAVHEFRFRWVNYKSNCRKHQRGVKCMQQHLYKHFCSSNHCFISDVSVTFIDKTDPSDLLNKKITGEVPWKPWLPLVLKCVKAFYFGVLVTLYMLRQCWAWQRFLAGHCQKLSRCTFKDYDFGQWFSLALILMLFSLLLLLLFL